MKGVSSVGGWRASKRTHRAARVYDDIVSNRWRSNVDLAVVLTAHKSSAIVLHALGSAMIKLTCRTSNRPAAPPLPSSAAHSTFHTCCTTPALQP